MNRLNCSSEAGHSHKPHKKKKKLKNLHRDDPSRKKNDENIVPSYVSEVQNSEKNKTIDISDPSPKKLLGKKKKHKHDLLLTSNVGESRDEAVCLKHKKKKKCLGLADNSEELSSLSSDGAMIQTISEKRKKRKHKEIDLDESATQPKEVVVAKTFEKSSGSDSVTGDRKEIKKRKRDQDSSFEQSGVSELDDVPQKKKKSHKETKATLRRHKHKKSVVISESGLSDSHEVTNDDDDDDYSPPKRKKRPKENGATSSRLKHKVKSKSGTGGATEADDSTDGASKVPMTATERSNFRRGFQLLPIEESIAKLGRQMRDSTDFSYWKLIRELLDEKHIPYRVGKWASWEDKILTKNWEQLIEEMPDTNLVEDIIYAKHDKKENIEKIRFLKESQFYRRLFKNIPRLGYSIYIRARKLFDPRHHHLDLTEEETATLDYLIKTHGNKWATMGKEMEYSGQALINYLHLKELKTVNGTPFTKKEDDAIIKAVRLMTGEHDIKGMYRDIPWKQILTDGGILARNKRTPQQLRLRWINHLCWSMSHPGERRKKHFSPENQSILITMIYESDALEEHEIDFDSLLEEFEGVPSPFALRKYWCHLRSLVPDWHWKKFNEIIEYLYDEYIPKLIEGNDDLIPIEEDGFDDKSDEDS